MKVSVLYALEVKALCEDCKHKDVYFSDEPCQSCEVNPSKYEEVM